MPYKWKNPDINNNGVVDGYDFLEVSAHFGEANAYDLNYDGVVDIDDIMFVGTYWGQPRPKDEDLPTLPEVYTLRFSFLKGSFFDADKFSGIIDGVLVAPARLFAEPLGYLYTTRVISIAETTVTVDLYFQKWGSPSPGLPAAVWAAIAIGVLIAVGVIIIGIAWIYQARVEEQRLITTAEISEKLKGELEAGLITKEQYTDLMGKLLETKGEGADMWGTITGALPLLIGLALVGAVVGIMPRRREE